MAIGCRSKYGGNLTGGALLVRESRIMANIMMEVGDASEAKAKVIDENLFQNKSIATTQKYCNLIALRFRNLKQSQIKLVAQGSNDAARAALFVAVLKTYPLVASFVSQVLVEKVRCFEPHLKSVDWTNFLEAKETVDPEINSWTENSRKKMGQVIFRMLSEAGFLDNTRSKTIQYPHIPNDLEETLGDDGDEWILRCLKLGKGA